MKSLIRSSQQAISCRWPNTLLALIAFFWSAMFFASCGHNNGIPVDETRAKSQIIPLEQGEVYQANFLKTHEELKKLLSDTNFLEKNFRMPNAEFFNRDAIATLLNIPGADGIRVYLGIDPTGETKYVLVPVDKDGNDIITALIPIKAGPGKPPYTAGGDSQVVENGQVCPQCQIGH
jgi:hypothetical protein